MKSKAFFMIFKGLSLKQIKQIILEGENPSSNEPFEEKVKKKNVDSNVLILHVSINKSEKFNHKSLIKTIFFFKKVNFSSSSSLHQK